MTDYPAINDPEWDELVFRAEGYGIYYATHHPGYESPLSYEYADMLTINQLLETVGVTEENDETDGLIDAVCQAFEDAYAEQDTDSWKHPDCICPRWDAVNRVQVAADAQCPAHDSDAWTAHVNNHQKD